jgi:transcriptional regulator with XRE-family HTH domain
MNGEASATELVPGGVGELLRWWRESRHVTQLELALQANASVRHISFVETGKAAPSQDMLVRLASVLDVPLRDRNVLLQAAGYAPVYRETRLDHPRMRHVRAALELILGQHEPRSAIACDRHWNIVMANVAFVRFLTVTLGAAPPGLSPLAVATAPSVNLLHLLFDPAAVRRVIRNWEVVAKSILTRVHRHAAWTRDDTMRGLLEAILEYPGVPTRWRELDLEAPQDLVLPIELHFDGKTINLLSTVTSLGTPQDISLQELHIEAFFPADAEPALPSPSSRP